MTAYQVLARKYRPTKLSDLVGQETLVTTLQKGLSLGRLPHAFLLHGIRGVGKTTTARIMAKALNCKNATQENAFEPCGTCQSCEAIAADRHLDVIEMDAASHTSVDDVRDIIESVPYKAVMGDKKVYIIDEVHMLSKSAFNALLKTLEEPPSHVTFIFATTELKKVPDTVLSRCMRFDLKRIESEALQTHLKKICALENVTIEESALLQIVRASEGSARDSLSLLDQAIALSGGSITAQCVQEMLGLVDQTRLFDLLSLMLTMSVEKTLELCQELLQTGADPVSFLESLMEVCYLVTCAKTAPNSLHSPSLTADQRQLALDMSALFSLTKLMRTYQVLNKGYEELLKSPLPSIALEMLLIRVCYLTNVPDFQSLLSNSPRQESVACEKEVVTLSQVISVPVSNAVEIKKKEETPSVQEKKVSSLKELVAFLYDQKEPVLAGSLTYDVKEVSFKDKHFVFEALPQAPKNLSQQLKLKLQELTHATWQIEQVMSGGKTTLQEEKEKEKKILEAKALSHPLVQKFQEAFPQSRVKV